MQRRAEMPRPAIILLFATNCRYILAPNWLTRPKTTVSPLVATPKCASSCNGETHFRVKMNMDNPVGSSDVRNQMSDVGKNPKSDV